MPITYYMYSYLRIYNTFQSLEQTHIEKYSSGNTIHTIGDSHSYNGWNNISRVSNHHLGPKLAFSIGRDGLDLSTFNIKEGDIVVFSFGEIDCRCHIHKYISDTKDYKQVIDSIIEAYIKKINEAVSSFKNIKVVLYNIVPPIEKYNTEENPEYPYLGSDQDRKKYSLYYNEKLIQKCKENNYIFFDIYHHYADSNGYLKKSLSDGNVHIRDGTYIKEFIDHHLH